MARARTTHKRKRHSKAVGPHAKGRKGGRCPHCGAWHDRSAHWSHVHGTHTGAHGETSWYGRTKRPQGKRKRLPKRTATQMLAMGRRRPARAKTTRARALAEARLSGEHPTVEPLRRGKKHKHHVAGHLAKNPHHKGRHRVRGHMAALPEHHAPATMRSPTHHARKKHKKSRSVGAHKRKTRGERLAATYRGHEEKGFLVRANAVSAARASGKKVRRDRKTGRYHLV